MLQESGDWAGRLPRQEQCQAQNVISNTCTYLSPVVALDLEGGKVGIKALGNNTFPPPKHLKWCACDTFALPPDDQRVGWATAFL